MVSESDRGASLDAVKCDDDRGIPQQDGVEVRREAACDRADPSSRGCPIVRRWRQSVRTIGRTAREMCS